MVCTFQSAHPLASPPVSPFTLGSEGAATSSSEYVSPPPSLKILLLVLVLGVVASGLMVIGQHKFLRSIDRFIKDHQSLLCLLDFIFAILNLHSIGDWYLPRINLHWLRFVLLLLDAKFLALRTNLGWSLLRPV